MGEFKFQVKLKRHRAKVTGYYLTKSIDASQKTIMNRFSSFLCIF